MSPRYRTLKVPDFPPPPPTPMPTALEQTREDAALGAAWRRCEAALPEGYTFSVGNAAGVMSGRYVAVSRSGDPIHGYAYGPTPTAALEALAAKLESL